MSFFFFHPAFVHFPIAFYFLETGLLIAWSRTGNDAYYRFAAMVLGWGYIFMLLSMCTGLMNAGGFQGLKGKVAVHFYAALALFGFYTLHLMSLWRSGARYCRSHFYVGVSVLGNILVALTAYCGGRLVYS